MRMASRDETLLKFYKYHFHLTKNLNGNAATEVQMAENGNISARHFISNSQFNVDLKGVLLKVKNQHTKVPLARFRLKFDSLWNLVTHETGEEETGGFLEAQLVLVFCHRQHR